MDAICLSDHDRFYVSVDIPMWTDLGTLLLLLVPSAPVFSCHTSLVLVGNLCPHILKAAQTEYSVRMIIRFVLASFSEVFETFNCDTCLAFSVPCPICLRSTCADLIEQAGLCYILHVSRFDLVMSFFAWYAMRAVNWPAVSTVFGSCQLPYKFVWGRGVWVFRSSLCTSSFQWQDNFIDLFPVRTIPSDQNLPTWSRACHEAAQNFHLLHDTPMPDSFLDTPVLMFSSPLGAASPPGLKVAPIAITAMAAAHLHYYFDVGE